MKQVTYDSEVFHRPLSSLGLVVLQTDETIEEEMRGWLPDGVAMFHSRVPNATEVTAKTLSAMEAEIPRAVELFPEDAQIGAVAYACTSGSTVIGEAEVAAAVRKALPNVVVTNPISAVKARLRDLAASRVGLLTPYIPEISQAMIENLEADGFITAASASFFEIDDPKVARISNESVLKAMIEVGSGDCDAVFASCTNLRTAGVLDEAERVLGKPVISSNSALMWHMLQLRDERLAKAPVEN